MKPLFLLFSAVVLTACGSSQKFAESDLHPEIYKGYWAMAPVNDIHRVVKFHPNGMVNIYEYSCESEGYRLDETITHYLSKERENTFTLLDDKKKAFARFEIVRLNANQLQAREQFYDKQIEPNSLYLNYTNYVGAKPICGFYHEQAAR